MVLCFLLLACGRRRVVLKWEDTSGSEDGFRIYRITPDGREKIAEVGSNVVTYVDDSPVPKACYAVTSFNSAGESEPSNIGCFPG